MAKGKTLNPADAQRKAERKKELKKNKAERQKTRDFALVKKDTTDLEEEIQRLEKAEIDETITPSERTQLPTLRAELKRINKKKEEYVTEHPEHRRLVYRARHTKTEETQGVEGEGKKKERKVFDKNGIPRHPERSIYYDSVMNPFGVPPPGMPYMERPLRPDEVDSEADDESDEQGESDDDVSMPPGPPPPSKSVQPDSVDDDAYEEDSDDDIPMPEGPPPSQVQSLSPPLPNPSPPYYPNAPMSFPPGVPPSLPPPGFPSAVIMKLVPPIPSNFSHPYMPLPPPSFPTIPPPPPGFSPHPGTHASLPPRPRIQSEASTQDPLLSAPHVTFQSHRTIQAQMTYPLPDKPAGTLPSLTKASVATSGASTISAPAQLRDFKKESTAFMPSSLKRKKLATSSPGSRPTSKRINAAPLASDKETAGEAEPVLARPDLLGILQSNFPARSSKRDTGQAADKTRPERAKDDYAKFVEEIGDIL